MFKMGKGEVLSKGFGNKMNKQLSLKIILGVSIAGMLFSGFLSYGELFKGVCLVDTCSYLLLSCVSTQLRSIGMPVLILRI